MTGSNLNLINPTSFSKSLLIYVYCKKIVYKKNKFKNYNTNLWKGKYKTWIKKQKKKKNSIKRNKTMNRKEVF